jgi:hypothetical protein
MRHHDARTTGNQGHQEQALRQGVVERGSGQDDVVGIDAVQSGRRFGAQILVCWLSRIGFRLPVEPDVSTSR